MKGIKISKQRRNVKQATSSELVLDSTKPGSFKIFAETSLKIITTWVLGAQQDITVSYPHNLGYVPAHSSVVNIKSSGVSQHMAFQDGLVTAKVYADKNNIYAHVQATTSDTYTFHIVIFSERLDV